MSSWYVGQVSESLKSCAGPIQQDSSLSIEVTVQMATGGNKYWGCRDRNQEIWRLDPPWKHLTWNRQLHEWSGLTRPDRVWVNFRLPSWAVSLEVDRLIGSVHLRQRRAFPPASGRFILPLTFPTGPRVHVVVRNKTTPLCLLKVALPTGHSDHSRSICRCLSGDIFWSVH